jgi:uncharacterized membrane protein YeaQ/YmgE (transglycosylase-associated protein family)
MDDYQRCVRRRTWRNIGWSLAIILGVVGFFVAGGVLFQWYFLYGMLAFCILSLFGMIGLLIYIACNKEAREHCL